jgi:hypothetical protein
MLIYFHLPSLSLRVFHWLRSIATSALRDRPDPPPCLPSRRRVRPTCLHGDPPPPAVSYFLPLLPSSPLWPPNPLAAPSPYVSPPYTSFPLSLSLPALPSASSSLRNSVVQDNEIHQKKQVCYTDIEKYELG